MNLYIIIKGAINSKELYLKLRPYDVNVIDMCTETYIFAGALNEYEVDNIIKTCKSYGEFTVDITNTL